MKNNFYDFTITALKSLLLEAGFKAFNADQIYKWVYEQNEKTPENMSNLSKELIFNR